MGIEAGGLSRTHGCAHTHTGVCTYRCRHAYTQAHAGALRYASEHAYACRWVGRHMQVGRRTHGSTSARVKAEILTQTHARKHPRGWIIPFRYATCDV